MSSNRGQGNFRGLEAEAKYLTFEHKAKDFKMCPRGQRICQALRKKSGVLGKRALNNFSDFFLQKIAILVAYEINYIN